MCLNLQPTHIFFAEKERYGKEDCNYQLENDVRRFRTDGVPVWVFCSSNMVGIFLGCDGTCHIFRYIWCYHSHVCLLHNLCKGSYKLLTCYFFTRGLMKVQISIFELVCLYVQLEN